MLKFTNKMNRKHTLKNNDMKTMNLTILLAFALLECGTTTAQVLEQDSLALVAFYNSTGGPNWTHNNHWLTDPVSTWYGVTVEGDRVIELEFNSDNNLNGFVPEDIGDLNEIITFVIGNNPNLAGNLPGSIGQLTNMQWFGIGNCSIIGTIPNTIGNLIDLLFLNFSDNNLTGEIPHEIGNLFNLQFLILFGNQLTGVIPPELGNCNSLLELSLGGNQLNGTIPVELTNLENLTTLGLSNNLLSGKIPEYLSNLFFNEPSITINVSHNLFSGPVPNSWGNLSFLIDGLGLSYNNFTSLPTVNYNWIITFFHIEGNRFTFEHIESHYQSYLAGLYYFFYYYPQDSIGVKIDTALVPQSNYRIYSGTGGEYTNYKWFRNGELILESPDADSLHLENISYADTGIYTCKANSSLIYFLNLYRKPVHITIDTSGVNIDHFSVNNKIELYPNPAAEFVWIDLPDKSKIIDFKILDMNGKSILHCESVCLTDYKTMINVAGIKQGIYLLQVKTENSNYTTKLIKNNRGESQ
jgi:hypothetical protein